MKRTLKIALIVLLAVSGSYARYSSTNEGELSDLALSNLEALSLSTKDCIRQQNSYCYGLVVGAPGEPNIGEISQDKVWVNRYSVPGD